jgi:hypothetical protein
MTHAYAVQYLETNPETVALAPQAVGDRLRAAFERLRQVKAICAP